MEGERYAVKWDLHRDIIMENLERMYSLNSLTDCVLMAGEREIHAHKLLLSSCSSYFKKLLEKTADKVPVFIFNEISFEELRSLVEYMYRGEVTVDQRTASRLLKIGKDLKIQGLVHDPKNVKEKPPANFPWENQPGYTYGSFPQLPQNYSTPNNGWNYQNFPQSAGQQTGYNGNMDQSQNFYPGNNFGNDVAGQTTKVGPIEKSKGYPKKQTPSQALSGQILNLISPRKTPETPKRKKDECFKSPPTSRKKCAKVFTEPMAKKSPETDNLIEKNVETQQKDTESTQELSNIMKSDDEIQFTFPSLPPIITSEPLNPTYVSSDAISDTAESIDISEIGIPLSYQEKLNDSDDDIEASDSGINTSPPGTQDDPKTEEIKGPMNTEVTQEQKDLTKEMPTQVFETSLNKKVRKSSKEDDHDESTGDSRQ